jgi:phosphatidylinositol 3,5-bisphosphate 5-phosphatase
VTSFETLLVVRALLGISEAAFGPGVPFYLSFFYRRDELALRTGIFISAAPLATSFASSLAWLIVWAGRNVPLAPWRMLFLVEGFPSIIVAIFAWTMIPDSPASARYLTRRERKIATIRLQSDETKLRRSSAPLHTWTKHDQGLKMKEILETLMDPKCYFSAVNISHKASEV